MTSGVEINGHLSDIFLETVRHRQTQSGWSMQRQGSNWMTARPPTSASSLICRGRQSRAQRNGRPPHGELSSWRPDRARSRPRISLGEGAVCIGRVVPRLHRTENASHSSRPQRLVSGRRIVRNGGCRAPTTLLTRSPSHWWQHTTTCCAATHLRSSETQSVPAKNERLDWPYQRLKSKYQGVHQSKGIDDMEPYSFESASTFGSN